MKKFFYTMFGVILVLFLGINVIYGAPLNVTFTQNGEYYSGDFFEFKVTGNKYKNLVFMYNSGVKVLNLTLNCNNQNICSGTYSLGFQIPREYSSLDSRHYLKIYNYETAKYESFIFYVKPRLNTTIFKSCSGPDGSIIQHNQSKTYFKTQSVLAGNTCLSQNRICNNGVLSGTYTFTSCYVQNITTNPNLYVTFTQNGEYYTGDKVTFYVNGTKYYKTAYIYNSNNVQISSTTFNCSSTCSGLRIGDYILPTNSVAGSYKLKVYNYNTNRYEDFGFSVKSRLNTTIFKSCSGPDGSIIQHNQSKVYFKNPRSSYFGLLCYSQKRVCTNGVLSGSYIYSTCR